MNPHRNLIDLPPELTPEPNPTPYVPPNAPVFEVGDRVRVTAGIAECTLTAELNSHFVKCGEKPGHLAFYAGQKGTIEYEASPFPSHPYIVVTDERTPPCPKCGRTFGTDDFAPSELAPLDDEVGVDPGRRE